MNKIDLVGRTAVVTGGVRGIGLAIAERLLASGANVCVWDRDLAALDQVVPELMKLGKAHGAQVDITRAESVEHGVKSAISSFGKIDILVNNAGIAGSTRKLWELPPDEWRQVIEIDLIGVYLCCRAVVPHMIENKYGRIVNIASIAGKEGNPNASHYSAAKAGVIALTKSLGKELAQLGILVHHPRSDRDRYFEASNATAYRLYAFKNPDGKIREKRRSSSNGSLAMLRRLLVYHWINIRSFRRPCNLLIPLAQVPALLVHLPIANAKAFDCGITNNLCGLFRGILDNEFV